ncbi:MAG TPA: TPM domain-containing protein [Cyclobacteriaceae bacterium]|nr:TPM domain-containing protein [Cyclobacteriaceae bacterium]HNU41661.1 TPM domain-containing protein [Cyclobacteriaceae bacterium]
MKNCLWLFVLLAGLAQAQTYTIQTVPNTKLIDNSYVSNPNNLLSEKTVAQINQQLAVLEKQTSAQVAVVLLSSIGDANDFDFAQGLFRLWGIGKSGNDNGLLILYVEDQHIVRIHTGYGLEGILPDATCKRIEMQFMVPHFRNGDTDAGMLAGLNEVIHIISNPQYASEVNANESPGRSAIEWFALIFMIGWAIIFSVVFLINLSMDHFKKAGSKEILSASLSVGQWLLLVLMVPIGLAYLLSLANSWILLLVVLYVYLDLLVVDKYKRVIACAHEALGKESLYKIQHFMKVQGVVWSEWALIFPIPFAFIGGRYKKIIQELPTYPRLCQKCNQKMSLQSADQNNFLTDKQQFEAKIESATYYIWQCKGCASTLIERNPSNKNYFERCMKCGVMAFQSTLKTIRLASQKQTGLQLKVGTCKYCNYTEEQELILPKLQKHGKNYNSDRTSDDSGSSWSSSSGSDSGGSWGGGDSGGGGASSRW